MAEWFASGRVVDLIILLTVAEGIAAVILHRRFRRGPPPAVMLPHLAAGIGLLLALRAALTDKDWVWIALALLAALVAHVADAAGLFRAFGSRR